jgi:hypothetical protein
MKGHVTCVVLHLALSARLVCCQFQARIPFPGPGRGTGQPGELHGRAGSRSALAIPAADGCSYLTPPTN